MECPECHKDSCVLVTTTAKKKVRERRGLFLTIILAPWWALVALWRMIFGRRQQYYKKTEWVCNYCGHKFPAEEEQEAAK